MASASSNSEDMISGINVTPLVDIMLVLLIVFMVTAQLIASQSVPLDLPKAATAGTTQTLLTVTVDERGALAANGRALANPEALGAEAQRALAGNRDLRVVIAASRAASHGMVMTALDTLRSAGATKIAFAAEKTHTPTH